LTLALSLVVIALIGNFMGEASTVISFFAYVSPIFLICLLCLYAEK
jgi:hypothetical protein